MISPFRILLVFLRLGCISFGGPIAHVGYFREEFVARRGWLREDEFADVFAIAQTLPGPASSQTGFAVGLLKGGWVGGLAAWTGFTLPSALLMFAFAYAQKDLLRGVVANGVLHGLQVVAVAVVAQAVMSMQRRLAADRVRASIAVIAAAVALLCPAPFNTVLAIASGALCSIFLPRTQPAPVVSVATKHTRRGAMMALTLFCLPFALSFSHSWWVRLFNCFYQSGALVFGGGHVILPLLQSSVVAAGFVDERSFLAGYGAAQAIPGPLSTFSAYLGAVAGGPLGAALALIAIFAPGLLLMMAVLPFWSQLSRSPGVKRVLGGINAAVVGVLAAALYAPIWISTIHTAVDFAIALGAFVLLAAWKVAPWKLVLLTAFTTALVTIV